MLKINPKKDIKELEKFGYELLEYDNYYRKFEKDYQVQINIYDRNILVFKKRKNSDWGDYIGYSGEEEKVKKYIYDLIKADMVVKE